MEKKLRENEKRKKLDGLTEKLSNGRLTRRDFIRGGIALGFSLSFLSGIANLYSKEAFGQEDIPSELMKKVREEGSKLNVYNWSFYIDPKGIEKFEKEFDIDVTYDLFESAEEGFAKISAGGSGYDVAYNDDSWVKMLWKRGKLLELNHEWLTNIGNLKDKFRDPAYDPNNKYSIAWQWGTTGFCHNTKYTKGDLRLRGYGSWSILFEGKEYSGKMTMMNSANKTIGSALKYLGYSYNAKEEDKLREAEDVLLTQKPWLKAYMMGPVRKLLIGEEVWLAQLWSGDSVFVHSKNPAVEYVLPKEGMKIWVTNMIVPKDAPHPATAHLWLNYFLRPEPIAAVSKYVKYGCPNQAAMPYMPKEDKENPAINPPKSYMDKLEFEEPYTGKALELREEIWEKLKG